MVSYKNRNKFAGGFLVGTFADRASIENAYNASRNSRYTDSDIYMIMSENSRKSYFPSDNQYEQIVRKGTIADIIAYSAIHESTGIISSIETALLLPAAGAIVTGDFGNLVKETCKEQEELACILELLGIPIEKADLYAQVIHDGRLLLAVRIKQQDLFFFVKNWEENHALEIIYVK